MDYDVVILGGGPAGSTVSTLLKKYRPELSVCVLERAKFPRDHVGESQLPSIGPILEEMGCWSKVEEAGFPIKIGASYTWGRSNERWDFDFYPVEQFEEQARPGEFTGARRQTAFQVDRAIYDNILLRHAESMGVDVREETRVVRINTCGDRVESLELESGETVRGRRYVDATGTAGVIRKAIGIEAEVPEALKNIAIWDYWQNAKWAVEIGVGATRVQVRSLPFGWLWFIPLGPTRTSIGLVCPADYYKASGKDPEALYLEAIAMQEDVASLVDGAEREGEGIQTCKDYSNLPDRVVGENWYLVGEAAGFADPILAAGMTIAHSSARDCAYTILELEREEHDPVWLRDRFDHRSRTNVQQHIRFAQFWYSANTNFTDLQEHCAQIAKEAGLRKGPNEAWRWLSQGGFTTEFLDIPSVGSFDISTTRQLISRFNDRGSRSRFLADGYNEFRLNLKGARKERIGKLENGRIEAVDCWVRGGCRLPVSGAYEIMIRALEQASDISEIVEKIRRHFPGSESNARSGMGFSLCIQTLEMMITEHWVIRSVNKRRPMLTMNNEDSKYIRASENTDGRIADANPSLKYVSNI